jgi:hypothetical protein
VQQFSSKRTEALSIACIAALTVTAGVAVLAVRCSRAKLGDGPISFSGVVILGVPLLAVPIAIVAYRAAQRTRRLTLPVALISLVSAIVIAACPPGNLMALGIPFVLAPAMALVWLAEALLAKPRRS